ncbi:ABC transporter ATP-binding protein [Boudabousia marimammalium]|uniref:ABC transporter ATP-binding protein n=1 Tax=Boudabousia marimammalium TaxID=156892 RepID=A0A1Q5PMT9_9ACTO|nr:ABC transporter ATP-binding protein [Boudabousia marimammalium]
MTGAVMPGEALALIGPNGSGKTTLLRGILSLITVSEGNLKLLGSDDLKTARQLIGYVPQLADIDPTFPVTVRTVVEMGIYNQLRWWQSARTKRQKVMEALERVGMADRAGLRFGTLSGGQQQRVLLARATVGNPHILLLDEPFNGLDQPNRQALLEAIENLKAAGVAIIVSTHDMDLAHAVCEKVLLVAGEQIAFGPRDKTLTEPNLRKAFGGLPDQGANLIAKSE